MADTTRIPLHALSRALESRYSGVQVEAFMQIHSSDRNPKPVRIIQFIAPRALLIDHGILDPNGSYADQVSEFGTSIIVGDRSDGLSYSIHNDNAHEGAACGRLLSQNPDNAKTRAVVAKILSRIARNSHRPTCARK